MGSIDKFTDNNFLENFCECECWENDYCWAYGKPVSEVNECPERNKSSEEN